LVEGRRVDTRPIFYLREKTEYSTNGSTGQREKAPAEPVCLITLLTGRIKLAIAYCIEYHIVKRYVYR